MDALSIIKGLLPIAGEVIGGPLGEAGTAWLADKIGAPAKTVQAVADTLQGIDPLKRQELENDMIKWHIEESDKMIIAYLADTQDARKRDTEIRKAGQHNYRADAIVFVTFAGILACISVAVGITAINEFGKTCINVVLGVLLADWKQITSFEFGSSKSSHDKDETINALTKG